MYEGNVTDGEPKHPNAIVPLDAAAQMLAEATTLEEIKPVVDRADFLRRAFRDVAHNRKQANESAALWLRAMRKGGELIVDARPHSGRPRAGNPATNQSFAGRVTTRS